MIKKHLKTPKFVAQKMRVEERVQFVRTRVAFIILNKKKHKNLIKYSKN